MTQPPIGRRGRVRVLWLNGAWAWGPWKHSDAYRWIFDVGPVRILREAPLSRKGQQ